MVQFINLGKSSTGKFSEELGKALGGGISNAINHYYAGESINKVLKNPKLKNSPLSEKLGLLEEATRPFGEMGQNILKNLLMVEQRELQEKEESKNEKAKKTLAQMLFQENPDIQESGISVDQLAGLPLEQLQKIQENKTNIKKFQAQQQQQADQFQQSQLAKQIDQKLQERKVQAQEGKLALDQEKHQNYQSFLNELNAGASQEISNEEGISSEPSEKTLISAPNPSLSAPAFNLPNPSSFRPSDETLVKAALFNPTLGNALANIRNSSDEKARQQLKDIREREEKFSDPMVKANEEARESLISQQRAVKQIIDAVQTGDNGGLLSGDFIAEMTGLENFRSKSGAVLQNALKEYLLSNVVRAGSRPNQWIEQQIAKSAPAFGRTREANEDVAEIMQANIDIKAKGVELFDELQERYKKELGFVPSDINKQRDKLLKDYAKIRDNQASYRMQEIAEKENPKLLTSLDKVRPGTPLTVKKAQFLVDEYGDQALEAAKILGYTFLKEEDLPNGFVESLKQAGI